MKINELFNLVDKQRNKQSFYETVRELIIIKRHLKLPNSVDAIFNNYSDVFDYIVENYNATDSDTHIKNLDEIMDLYYGGFDTDTDRSDEASDASSEASSQCESENGMDINLNINFKPTADAILDVTAANFDNMYNALASQHTKTRWLLGANVVMGLGNIVLAAMGVYNQLMMCRR